MIYTSDAHEAYVLAGGCPSVKPLSKTWCNGRDGHPGEHWALHYLPGVKVETVKWERGTP